MSYTGTYIKNSDFSGGYSGNYGFTTLALNQALDSDNLILTSGKGFRMREGNSKINTSVFNSGTAWQGVGTYYLDDGTSYLVGISGTKFATNAFFGTSFTDSTGTVTITTGATNQWTFLTFNNTLIAFGGPGSTPDAPFKWTGTGNAAALGGSPPSAYGAFTTNNRLFAFRTSSNPSTIYWSVLGNAEDWSSTGSGSAVAGSLSDNQQITAAVVINTNYALIFKNTSTYQMILTQSPFPVYSLFPNVGCPGKNACINIDGNVYWINQRGRMVSTDGQSITEYPTAADNLWDTVQASQYQYIVGVREKRVDYDWLVWLVSTTGSTNNKAIIWDLRNKCWLQCTSGYKMALATNQRKGLVAYAGYDGFVYQFSQSVLTDASESGASVVGYWRSGWIGSQNLEPIIQPNQFGLISSTYAGSGTITVSYGFDFTLDSNSFTLSNQQVSSETSVYKTNKLHGRGNFFNFKISPNTPAVIEQVVLRGKIFGQKVLAAS